MGRAVKADKDIMGKTLQWYVLVYAVIVPTLATFAMDLILALAFIPTIIDQVSQVAGESAKCCDGVSGFP